MTFISSKAVSAHHLRSNDKLIRQADMWWNGGLNQTRWIPYRDNDLFASLEAEQEALSPPAGALEQAPPQFMLWSTLPGSENDRRLDFMRNKHIALNCKFMQSATMFS